MTVNPYLHFFQSLSLPKYTGIGKIFCPYWLLPIDSKAFSFIQIGLKLAELQLSKKCVLFPKKCLYHRLLMTRPHLEIRILSHMPLHNSFCLDIFSKCPLVSDFIAFYFMEIWLKLSEICSLEKKNGSRLKPSSAYLQSWKKTSLDCW